jgi:hypothetical protein
VTDEVADRPDVILHLLRECQSAAHQPREPLPECIIEPLDKAAARVTVIVGLSGFMGYLSFLLVGR